MSLPTVCLYLAIGFILSLLSIKFNEEFKVSLRSKYRIMYCVAMITVFWLPYVVCMAAYNIEEFIEKRK